MSSQVMKVSVSNDVEKKVVQLYKIQKYSTGQPTWGRDEKVLRYNLLQVPSNNAYKVLLAMGKRAR